MPDSFHIATPEQKPPERQRFPLLLPVLAAAIVAVVSIYFWPGGQKPRTTLVSHKRLPFGPAERKYAPKIQLGKIALSRAENFLHQEVITLSGELLNGGDRPLRDVEITIEFSDQMHQVVLRETRAVFGGTSTALAPGGSHEFEVSFEHIPYSWNAQLPSVSVTGLSFVPAKQ